MNTVDLDVPEADSWVRQLDTRQRAMLAEMGVRVWAPPAAEPALPAPADTAAPAPTTAPVNPPPPQPAPSRPAAVARPAPPPPASSPAPVAAPAPVLAARPSGIERMDWPTLRETVASCQACKLCEKRHQTVFGTGHPQAEWFIVGEAPGENEDLQGEPFVGMAGQLLDRMLHAVGKSRRAPAADGHDDTVPGQRVYIANVLKCRPPANRNPQPDEVAQCAPYLLRQVALVQPRLILAMGRFAVQTLLQTQAPIGKLRGQVHQYQGIPVIVTYHPSYLLRTPADKARAWADLCLALETAGPERG